MEDNNVPCLPLNGCENKNTARKLSAEPLSAPIEPHHPSHWILVQWVLYPSLISEDTAAEWEWRGLRVQVLEGGGPWDSFPKLPPFANVAPTSPMRWPLLSQPVSNRVLGQRCSCPKCTTEDSSGRFMEHSGPMRAGWARDAVTAPTHLVIGMRGHVGERRKYITGPSARCAHHEFVPNSSRLSALSPWDSLGPGTAVSGPRLPRPAWPPPSAAGLYLAGPSPSCVKWGSYQAGSAVVRNRWNPMYEVFRKVLA